MGRYFMATVILLWPDGLLRIKITSKDSGRFFLIIINNFYYNYYYTYNYYNYYYTYTVLEDVIIVKRICYNHISSHSLL